MGVTSVRQPSSATWRGGRSRAPRGGGDQQRRERARAPAPTAHACSSVDARRDVAGVGDDVRAAGRPRRAAARPGSRASRAASRRRRPSRPAARRPSGRRARPRSPSRRRWRAWTVRAEQLGDDRGGAERADRARRATARRRSARSRARANSSAATNAAGKNASSSASAGDGERESAPAARRASRRRPRWRPARRPARATRRGPALRTQARSSTAAVATRTGTPATRTITPIRIGAPGAGLDRSRRPDARQLDDCSARTVEQVSALAERRRAPRRPPRRSARRRPATASTATNEPGHEPAGPQQRPDQLVGHGPHARAPQQRRRRRPTRSRRRTRRASAGRSSTTRCRRRVRAHALGGAMRATVLGLDADAQPAGDPAQQAGTRDALDESASKRPGRGSSTTPRCPVHPSRRSRKLRRVRGRERPHGPDDAVVRPHRRTLRIAEHVEAGTDDRRARRGRGCDERALHNVLGHLVDQGRLRGARARRFALKRRGPRRCSARRSWTSTGSAGGSRARGRRSGVRPDAAGPATRRSSGARSGTTSPPTRSSRGVRRPDRARAGTRRPTRTSSSSTGTAIATRRRRRRRHRRAAHRAPRAPARTCARTLVDLPGTVARAPRAPFETVGQSFFDPLPAGADLYILRSVLNDWPDEETDAILRDVGAAMGARSRADRHRRRRARRRAAPADDRDGPARRAHRLARRVPSARRASGLEVVRPGEQADGRFYVELRRS